MVPGTPPASCPHPSACIMGEYRSLAARGFCFHCCVAYARSGSDTLPLLARHDRGWTLVLLLLEEMHVVNGVVHLQRLQELSVLLYVWTACCHPMCFASH